MASASASRKSFFGFSQPLHAYEVIGLREQLLTKVIRRNVDGMRITIDLGCSDRERAIHMLKELICEIDGVRTTT
jgi:hypothetical protein